MLSQSVFFVNIREIPSKASFSQFAKIKADSPFFSINVLLLLNKIHVYTFFYFGPEFMSGPRTVMS